MNERVRKQYENWINLATNIAAWKVVRGAMPKKIGAIANFAVSAVSTVAGVGVGNVVSDILFNKKEDDVSKTITFVIEEESDEK